MTDQNTDVVTFLTDQHEQVKKLLSQVRSQTGDDQRESFQCLVRLLAVHETAEEEVVHPMVRKADGGGPIIDSRLAEEDSAKDQLFELEKLGTDDPDFDAKFAVFERAVLNHAEHEETVEFPMLNLSQEPESLRRMTKMVATAEKLAPTHPHPHGPQGATGNLLVGPFVAIADRARDALTSQD